MSKLQVDDIVNKDDTGSVGFSRGVVVTGVMTATSFSGGASGDFSIEDKIVHTGDTNTAIRFPAADTFTVETAGSERVRVTSGGLVGIGTAGPDSILHINPTADCYVTLEPGSTDGNAGLLMNNSVGAQKGYVLFDTDDDFLRFGTNNTERVRIDTNGKTGININNPGSYNSSGNELVLGNTGSNAGMTIVSNSSNNGHIFFADGTASGAQNRGIIKYEHGNDAMAFNTAESERLRLTSGGELLVGHGSVINNMKFGGSGDFGSHAEIIGANKGFANGLAILNYDATATIPALLKLATSRSDTAGTNAVVGNDNDNCGGIQFMGNDGTRFIDVARIDGVTDGTVGSNDMPGRLSFHVTADGASVVTERMRIAKDGMVRVLGGDASGALNVYSSIGGSTSANLILGQHSASSITSGTLSFLVYTNGNVVNANNSYGSLSDVNLKENIVDANSQWADIKGVRVRNYNFKEETGNETFKQLGVVAQEVEEVSPGLVNTNKDGIKSVNYSVLYMKSVKALQEAMNRIETLETKVAALEGS